MTGIVCLYKPEDMTSFAAVARVRHILREKKCGHTGTLDPMATGVLPVLLGGATRFAQVLPSHDKAYRATLRLGFITDTLDCTGTVLQQRPVRSTGADVEKALQGFVGEIEQIPPMFSAVSVNGVRLYELARKGVEVERKPRKVTVYSVKLADANVQCGEYTVEVACSAGTYIRTLVADLGEQLGCGAMLTQLERTAANGFLLPQCKSLRQLEEAAANGDTQTFLHKVDHALDCYPAVTVSPAQAVRFCNGGALSLERLQSAHTQGNLRVYAPDGTFLGLGEIQGEDLTVKRLFFDR